MPMGLKKRNLSDDSAPLSSIDDAALVHDAMLGGSVGSAAMLSSESEPSVPAWATGAQITNDSDLPNETANHEDDAHDDDQLPATQRSIERPPSAAPRQL